MSILVGITQRVVEHDSYKERRDVLAQDWAAFLQPLGISYIALPNNVDMALDLVKNIPLTGIILSGGNNIGEALDRDATERALLAYAQERDMPVLGVCRGMQMMHIYDGGDLKPVENHVKTSHCLNYGGQDISVNSYHDLGVETSSENFEVSARADDGNIEAIKHRYNNWRGIMWHPEREVQGTAHDIELMKEMFAR